MNDFNKSWFTPFLLWPCRKFYPMLFGVKNYHVHWQMGWGVRPHNPSAGWCMCGKLAEFTSWLLQLCNAEHPCCRSPSTSLPAAEFIGMEKDGQAAFTLWVLEPCWPVCELRGITAHLPCSQKRGAIETPTPPLGLPRSCLIDMRCPTRQFPQNFKCLENGMDWADTFQYLLAFSLFYFTGIFNSAASACTNIRKS